MKNTLKTFTSTVVTGVTLALATFFMTPPAVIAQNSMAAEILNAHNNYRKQVGVPPLKWSNKLANDAQSWAKYLASLGGKKLIHSKGTNQGENLWRGTSKAFSYTDMVNRWGSEKKYFKAGIFPNVSSTGNWSDVGHYTQIIWKNTTEVGCGVASAGGNDILVCRYSPPGNYQGQRVY